MTIQQVLALVLRSESLKRKLLILSDVTSFLFLSPSFFAYSILFYPTQQETSELSIRRLRNVFKDQRMLIPLYLSICQQLRWLNADKYPRSMRNLGKLHKLIDETNNAFVQLSTFAENHILRKHNLVEHFPSIQTLVTKHGVGLVEAFTICRRYLKDPRIVGWEERKEDELDEDGDVEMKENDPLENTVARLLPSNICMFLPFFL